MSRLTARRRPGGAVEVGHDCVDGWRDTVLPCPPWRVLLTDPLTVEPAVSCDVDGCRLAVRIIGGRIVDEPPCADLTA